MRSNKDYGSEEFTGKRVEDVGYCGLGDESARFRLAAETEGFWADWADRVAGRADEKRA